MALIELTYNPNVILPGMVAIVVADITYGYIFRQDSVFISILRSQRSSQ